MIEGKKPKFFYGYIIVLASFLIHMAMLGTFFTYGVFFEPVSTEFGWTRTMVSGAHGLCQVVLGLLAIAAGRLTDRFGPRIVVVVCAGFIGMGYLLMPQINAGWQLYLFFGVIVGIGMGGCLVPMTSTIPRWFVRRRGIMTGIVLSSSSVLVPFWGVLTVAPQLGLPSVLSWQEEYLI